jgi:hypothetical protein
MAHATGKRWHNYTQSQQYSEYLQVVASETGIPATELVQLNQGGRPQEQGTWAHPYIAIDFAAWCGGS